jgi:hypothetical protein
MLKNVNRIPILPFMVFFGISLIYSCTSRKDYTKRLASGHISDICDACYHLGETRDTSAVQLLLDRILDPRRSTNLFYKGMCVNYCRLVALKKISGLPSGRKPDQFDVDTVAALFYLDWAVKRGFIKSKEDVDIDYFK